MYKEEQDKSGTARSRRIEARVTESELSEVVRLAQQCGLTLSGYLRRCAMG